MTENIELLDNTFKVEVLSKTERPNLLCYLAMHQDYSEGFVWSELEKLSSYSEQELGDRIVRNCIKYHHWGVCYDDQTEVLTDRGWVLWSDVQDTDRLASFDLQSEMIKFETPISLIKYYTEESLYLVEGMNVNFAVTLDHKMVVSHRQKTGKFTPWYRIEAKEKMGKPYKIPRSGYLDKQQTINVNNPYSSFFSDDTFCRLIGFWLGDGSVFASTNCLKFKLKLDRKIEFLEKIIPSHLLNKTESGYVIKLDKIGAYFKNNFSEEGEKMLPKEFLFLPFEQVCALLDGLLSSDGTCRRSNILGSYDSTSLKLLNTIQSIITLNGLAGNITLNGKTANEFHKQCYRLTITDQNTQRIEVCQKSRTPSITESIIDYKGYVYCAKVSTGALVLRRKGKTFISGNCEHPSITFNVINFPHSVMVQARTHRIGITFDVQSQRYTSKRILRLNQVLKNTTDPTEILSLLQEVFYFRPTGYYFDREGNKYLYSEEEREKDIIFTKNAVEYYAHKVENQGYAPEHARDLLTQNIRQHFVVTFNARSLLHFCDLRLPKDAQPEIRNLAYLIFTHFSNWMPEVAEFYAKKRFGKNLLAP
jgi:thymidylate synthase (FAD)